MPLRSIRSRIFGVVVASLLPFSILIGAGLWKNYNDDQADAADRINFHARMLAARLDNHIASLDALLAGVARAVSFDPTDARPNDILLRRLRAELPPYVSNVQVFALDGSNIGTSSMADRGALYAGDRKYFLRILAGASFAIGEPSLARTNGQWVVSISRPLKDADGRLRAVLAVGTLLANFDDALGLKDLPANVAVQIFDEDGILVGARGYESAQLGAKQPHPLIQRAGERGREPLQVATWTDQVQRNTTLILAGKTPWLIAIGVPVDIAISAMMHNLWSGITLTAMTLLAALGLALAITRQVVRPLRQLQQDADILAWGDLAHRSSVTGSDEVGAVARALNQMAQSLERWQRETNSAREKAAAEASERRRAEELERRAKETLAAVIDASPVAIVCSNRERRIVVWSRSAEDIFGYSAEEAIGQPTKIVPPDARARSEELFRRAVNGEEIRDVELKRQRKDGTLVDVRVAAAPVYNRDGQITEVAWVYADITDEKRVQMQLHHLAHFDQLTGLPNRTALRDDVGKLFADQRSLAIALLDLDGFKQVNDTLGHSTGDQLLVETARRLQTIAADGYRVYRLGGDEFVIVTGGSDPRDLDEIASRILSLLSRPFEISEHAIHVGVSIGIAHAPADGTDIDELLANADLALYEAKAGGGHTRRFFMPILRARAQGRRELDLELRRAFENQEFALYFQPQIRLSDGALVGAEALIRWCHPSHGVIEPGAFIEALSDGAIAAAVGKWILQSACETLATWHAQGLALPRIAVNLFPTQVSSDALLSDVEDVLRTSGLAAAALELEITEKVALDYSNAALSLKQVSERGVYIAFDDFGTGYASVSSLTKYPVNRIKIDQSFVRDIEHNREHAAIVRSLIMMGHNLGLLVVAEGVETDMQARLLRAEGCDEAQGYLYARPLPRHEFEQYMRATHFPAASPLRWAHGSRA